MLRESAIKGMGGYDKRIAIQSRDAHFVQLMEELD